MLANARQHVGRSLVPDLYDVHLLSMSPSAFSLTGIERVDSAEFGRIDAGFALPRPRPRREGWRGPKVPF
jgi:hypothetical protein